MNWKKILIISIISTVLVGTGIGVFLGIRQVQQGPSTSGTATGLLISLEDGKDATLHSGKILQGNSYEIKYDVRPVTLSSVNVSVQIAEGADVVSVSKTTLTERVGAITVTGLKEGYAKIQFVIDQTPRITRSHEILVHEPEKLQVPQNLAYDVQTDTISFTSVENAEKYQIQFTNTQTQEISNITIIDPNANTEEYVEHTVSAKLFTAEHMQVISTQTDYELRVQAVGNIYEFSDSGFNQEQYIKLLKLSAPTNITNEGARIEWLHNEMFANGEISYVIEIDGVEHVVQDNNFTISSITAKVYEIKVKAVASDQLQLQGVFDSKYSEMFTLTKLAQPALNVDNERKVSGAHANSTFTFASVAGATSYEVAILPAINGDEQTIINFTSSQTREIVLDDRFLEGTTYTFTVTAKSELNNVLNSNQQVYSVTKLPTATNFRLEMGELKLNAVEVFEIVVRYEVVLMKDNKPVASLISDTPTFNFTGIDVEVGNYDLHVRTLAVHDEVTGNFAHSALTNTTLTFKKLAPPAVQRVKNDSTVEWNLVDSAEKYEIYFNDVKVDEVNASAFDQTDTTGNYVLQNNSGVSLVPGSHKVKIVAVGNVERVESVNYSFVKLAYPSGFVVKGDEISWSAVNGATAYAVKENNKELSVIGNTTKYTIADVLQGTNTLVVVAIGNNVNIISNQFTFEVTEQVAMPQNIRLQNGKLLFDSNPNHNYQLFVQNNGVMEKRGSLIDGGAFADNVGEFVVNGLKQDETTIVGLRAIAKPGTPDSAKLGSAIKTFAVQKLPKFNQGEVKFERLENDYESYRVFFTNQIEDAGKFIIIVKQDGAVLFEREIANTGTPELNMFDDITLPGFYQIFIVAVGPDNASPTETSIAYINSEQSEPVQIVKLPAPHTIVLQEGELVFSFDDAFGAPYLYEVQVTQGANVWNIELDIVAEQEFDLETELKDTTKYAGYNSTLPISVKLRAVGPIENRITSEFAEMADVETLEAVTNVVMQNTNIVWDAVTQSENTVVYDIYVITPTDEVLLVKRNHATNSIGFNEFEQSGINMLGGESYGVFVVAKSRGYFNSLPSDELTTIKLAQVQNIETQSGYQLTWSLVTDGANEIASGYEVLRQNGDNWQVLEVVEAGTSSVLLEGLSLNDGVNTLAVRAVGGHVGGSNYLTGDMSATTTVVKHHKVTGLKVEDGQLVWTHGYTGPEDAPEKYEIVVKFTESGVDYEQSYVINATENAWSLDILGGGVYTIEVYALGNNQNKIGSGAQTITTTKTTTDFLNLRSENGLLVWEHYSQVNNSEYEIYVSQDDVNYNFVAKTKNANFVFAEQDINENTLYYVRLRVVAPGQVGSNLSEEALQIIKLPKVQTLLLDQDSNNRYLEWEYDSDGNLPADSVIGYEILTNNQNSNATHNVDGKNTFSEYIENFVHDLNVAGMYEFSIRARGNSVTSASTQVAYLSGDYNGLVVVSVLDKVKNVAISNGVLEFSNSPMYQESEQNRPDGFEIVVTNELEEVYVAQISQTVNSWNFIYTDIDGNHRVPAGTYNLTIRAISTNNISKISSDFVTLTNVVVLTTPHNLQTTNGELVFEDSQNEEYDNLTVGYEIQVSGQTISVSGKDFTELYNKLTSDSKEVKIRAIANGAVYSDYSQSIMLSRLNYATGLSIVNELGMPTFKWNEVANSNKFRILIKPANLQAGPEYDALAEELHEALQSHVSYLEQERVIEFPSTGANNKFVIPTNLPAADYEISLIAIGSSKNSGESGHYISSAQSTKREFSVLAAPQKLNANNGIISWDAVTGALSYDVMIFEGFSVDEYDLPLMTLNVVGRQFNANNHNLPEGAYTLRVKPMGNQSNYIAGSDSIEIAISMSETLQDFRVIGGALTWKIDAALLKRYATGVLEEDYTGFMSQTDMQIVEQIITGQGAPMLGEEQVNSVVVNNLMPFANVVLEIAKAGTHQFTSFTTYQVLKPLIESNATLGHVTISYPLNFLEPDEYVVRARFRGNNVISESADLESGAMLSTSGTENIVPIVHLNSKNTSQLSIYKLPAPVTPSPAVENDNIRFNLVVGKNESVMQNYAILAKSETDDIVYPLSVSSGVGTTYSKAVTEIEGISAGQTYTLAVVALGTLLGDEGSTEINYITSNTSAPHDVQLLRAPETFKVRKGMISFDKNSSAENHILRIWNGPSENYEAVNDSTSDYIGFEINVNEAMNEATRDENLTLSEDGVYYYNLENNERVPQSPLNPYQNHMIYKAMVKSLGDGKSKISSRDFVENDQDINFLQFIKWPSVEVSGFSELPIENGMFKWSHVLSEVIGGGIIRPEQYKVTVQRYIGVDLDQEIEISSGDGGHYSVSGVVSNNILFELPDTDTFNARSASGVPYIYSISVSAFGSVEGQRGEVQFVTGNSTLSRTANRLQTPTGITTDDGVMEWNHVASASGYSVFVAGQELKDGNLEFGDEEEIPAGNEIRFEMLSGDSYESGVFMFSVKALARSNYLNSRKSDINKVLKLGTPALRLENGEVLWSNVNDPNSSVMQNKTIIHIKGPEGFDLANIDQLQNIVDTIEFNGSTQFYTVTLTGNEMLDLQNGINLKGMPVGEYEIHVKYIGSNGILNVNGDSYFTVNSKTISQVFTKLEAPNPTIEVILGENNEVLNVVEWLRVPGADGYNVVALKMDEGGVIQDGGLMIYDPSKILHMHKFNSRTNGFFANSDHAVRFNLQGVNSYDMTSPVKFGDSYYIYVEAFGENITATVGGTSLVAYSLSDDSELKNITIPVTPEDVSVNEFGVITWKNITLGSQPVLQINKGGEHWLSITLEPGTTSYELTEIGLGYSIQVASKLGDAEGGNQSGYSPIVYIDYTIYESGDGSQDNPYIITNAKQLYNINYRTHAHFELANDIDISLDTEYSSWKPIGEQDTAQKIVQSDFSGVLEGNGYSVLNLNYINTNSNNLSFITNIAEGGVVKNLRLQVNAQNINVENYAGIAINNYGTIYNVMVQGVVNNRHIDRTNIYISGIVKHNFNVIENVVNMQNIIVTENKDHVSTVSGIAYRNEPMASLTKSGNYGTLTGTAIGGIAYLNYSTISQVFNVGAINVNVGSGVAQQPIAGGIVASNETNGSISNSYARLENLVTITNNSQNSSARVRIGGLVGSNGENSSSISNSYVTYKSAITGAVTEGAVVGLNQKANITNVVWKDITPLNAFGTGSTSANVIKATEPGMKGSTLQGTLGLGVFQYEAQQFPELMWKAAFNAYWSL